MKNQLLGDRMKELEGLEAQRRLMPLLPIMARLDGRSFSRLTRAMRRPYDPDFMRCMQSVAEALAAEVNSLLTYVQSDEISLVWRADGPKSETLFDGRVQKLASVLAGMASVLLYQQLEACGLRPANQLPVFDCRVWAVPREADASATFLWRELDATRNSIQMAAQARFSHNELHLKNSSQLQDMLMTRGVNWNDYPADFKRGLFIQRRSVRRRFTAEELERLPERHAARANPDLELERIEYRRLDMPPFSQVSNREDVTFRGADPQTYQQPEGPPREAPGSAAPRSATEP